MKKKSAGFFFTIISAILAAASFVMYMINCRTDYFSSFGIDLSVVVCIAAGVVVEVAALIIARNGQKKWMDIFPVASSAVLTAAAVLFAGNRINEIAFILTFQKNDNTLADMQSAVAGIALCAAAAVISWISSFFDITKAVETEK